MTQYNLFSLTHNIFYTVNDFFKIKLKMEKYRYMYMSKNTIPSQTK